MGIRWRLLILTLGVAVPLAAVGIIDLRGMWSVSRNQLDDSVKQQAELAAVAFERWMDAQRQPLMTVAAIVSERGMNAAGLGENLQYSVQTHPHWIDLQVISASGERLLARPEGREPLPDALLEHVMEEVRRRKSWTVVTDRTKDEARPIFIIANPTREGGAVIARLDGAAMNELFGGVQLSDRSVIGIFDSQGRVLYRKRTTETPVDTNVMATQLLSALGDERKNALGDNQSAVIEVESPYDGVLRVYGISRAGATDCVVIVGIPSATLYEPARRQLTRHLYFSLLALCFAVIAVLIVSRSIVLPLGRLRDAAQAIGRGDLSERAPSKGRGEINELGTVFNTMADQIAEREERLKELDRLKSEFVSSVSHELRTPLTTIKTLTRVLQRGGQTEAERSEYLETIAEECDRQIDLVLNLLDLSRIESGAYKVTLSGVNVAEVVNSCLVAGRHAAEARNQRLEVDLPDELPRVLADERALRRVLSSLIENAVKYSVDGGRVLVQASAGDEGEVVLAVRDNGCGINRDDLPRVFEKFFRGRPASDGAASPMAPSEYSEAPGVGLGLYLTRTIVEHMGGRVTAENNASGGATFTVYLPAWTGDGRRETNSKEGRSVEAIAGD
ncbi:MAG TPA: sensor histidine kinase [Pyrinomonadaceae bacterium]